MKWISWFFLVLILTGCQPQPSQINVTILDGGNIFSLQTDATTPAGILALASLKLSETDKIHYRGAYLPPDFSLPSGGNYTLQVRRSHTLTLVTPDNEVTIQTTAANVGQALAQTGLQVFSADFIDPALDTPLDSDLTVIFRPARDLAIIKAGGQPFRIKSSHQTVGQALAAAGIPPFGLDLSQPGAGEPLPADGQIKITRILEDVVLQENPIPYGKKYEYSVDQPAGEQKILQTGEPGLTISRTRIRYEDGAETTKIIDAEITVRQPRETIISLSSQVNVLTLTTPNGQIQYWRAVQMYATSYSPCRSGISKCSYGTASGMPVKHGVVAMVPALYNQLVGSQVYIPGYGIGVVGDVGGGFSDGRLWIDLGYSDDDYQPWSGYQTVYFLAPAPANIPSVLN